MATTSFTRKEYIDMTKLHLLINSNVLLKWDDAQTQIEDETKRYPIISRLKNLESCVYDDSVEITYTLDKYGRYKNNNETGLGFSYTNMFGEIRKILANKYYNDLDIKNCHPVIIYNLCLKHGITKCSYLKKFIENREEILKQIVEDNPEGHMNELRIEGKKMDRDVAKRFLLTFFFGASLINQKITFNIKKLDIFIKQFYDELNNIIDTIYELDCYKEIAEYAKEQCKKNGKTDNERGSIFSRIICNYERQLIDLLTIEMETKGYKIGTYMYDGLFVENNKEIVKDDIDYFNKKLTDFFNVKNAMPIELTIKPMTNIDNKYLDVDIDYNKYLMFKKRLETKDKVCKINKPMSFYMGEKDYMPQNLEGETFISKVELKDIFNNMGQVNLRFTPKWKFIEAWLDDKYCKTYETIVFNPDKNFNNPNVLNKFTGFEIDKYIYDDLPTTQEERKEYCKVLFKFINDICCNDSSSIEYITNFISDCLKHPNTKLDAMPFFKGLAGTGKTTIFLLIQSIIGHKYCIETSELEEKVFGKFAQARVDKLLVLLDEVSYKTSSKFTDQLKTCITSDTMIIEPKCINAFRYNSYEKYMGCSNDDCPIPLDDNNRRIRMFDCNKVKYGTIEEKTLYFNEIYKIIGSNKLIEGIKYNTNYKILRCFYEYMLEHDTANYNYGANVNNEATNNIKNKCISYSFLQDHLYRMREDMELDEKTIDISLNRLFSYFDKYKERNKINMDISSNIFSRKLNTYSFITKKRTTKGIVYSFDIDKYKEFFNWEQAVEIDM